MARSREETQTVIDPNDQTMLAQMVRAETDVAIETAKKHPRNVSLAITSMRSLALQDPEVAAGCMYALPRGDGIEGPSARLAEIVMTCWGNCRAGARVIDVGQKWVTAQGVFVDLENNVSVSYDVRRLIVGSNGRRFSDDMIVVTGNAACSIALRNAIFKGVPTPFWRPIYEAARTLAIGDVKTIEATRAELVDAFGKMGVVEERILSTLKLEKREDITPDHVAMLRGTFTALRDGDTTIEQAFPAATKAEVKADAAKAFGGGEPKSKAAAQEPKPKRSRKKKPTHEPQQEEEQNTGENPVGPPVATERADDKIGRVWQIADAIRANMPDLSEMESRTHADQWLKKNKWTPDTLMDEAAWGIVKAKLARDFPRSLQS